MYIAILFVELTCRVHHVKCRAGWSTSWNQDCQEKYQKPKICRWHHPYGRKWRTKEPLDKSERENEKAGLKLNIQKTKIMAFCPISSVQFSCSVVYNSLRPHGLKHARLPSPSPTPRAYSDSCALSWWCHPTISSSVVPFSPAFSLSQNQGLFQWVSSSHQVAKILEFQHQHQSFQWIFRVDFL